MSDEPTAIAGRGSVLLQPDDAIYRDVVYRLHKELPRPDTDDPEFTNQIIEAAFAVRIVVADAHRAPLGGRPSRCRDILVQIDQNFAQALAT